VRERETVETRSPARSGGCIVTAAAGIALMAFGMAVALSPRLRARLFGGVAGHKVLLRVRSSPEGADVYIDDELAGTTPMETQVTPVPHRVRVVRRGFQPWHEQVDPVAQPEVEVSLPPLRLATLVVESEPEGAEVYLDEERRGLTPIEITDIEAGPHTVRVVRKPVYAPVLKRIELKEGERRRLAVRLESGLEELYLQRIKKNPAKLSNYTELLHLHVLNGDADKAAAVVGQAVSALKSGEPGSTELGQFFEEVRKLVRGQAGVVDAASRQKLLPALTTMLETLVTASPTGYKTYGRLVVLLIQADRFEDVYRVCEKTVSLPKGRGRVHYYVATVCLGIGDVSHAIRLLERAVELKPTFFSARLALGSAYQRAERLDDAMRQYTEAEKLTGNTSPYYQGRLQAEIARLLVARKDMHGAIERYRKAIALKAPTAYNCQWRLQFASLLVELGRKNEAIEQYKAIAKLAPTSEAGYAARRALRRLDER